jgi:hypothetical protein
MLSLSLKINVYDYIYRTAVRHWLEIEYFPKEAGMVSREELYELVWTIPMINNKLQTLSKKAANNWRR